MRCIQDQIKVIETCLLAALRSKSHSVWQVQIRADDADVSRSPVCKLNVLLSHDPPADAAARIQHQLDINMFFDLA